MKPSISKRFSLLMLSILPLTLAVLFSTSITAQTASAHSTHAQRPNSGSGAVVHLHVATCLPIAQATGLMWTIQQQITILMP